MHSTHFFSLHSRRLGSRLPSRQNFLGRSSHRDRRRVVLFAVLLHAITQRNCGF